MPDGKPGHVVLPLTPSNSSSSPFGAAPDSQGNNKDVAINFDEMVMEKLGVTFDPRLAGLCVEVMKDKEVIDSILKNPAFQELSDELALEVSSQVPQDAQEALLHHPEMMNPSPPSPALNSSSSLSPSLSPSLSSSQFNLDDMIPPLVDMKEDEDDSQLPPLETIEEEDLPLDNKKNDTTTNNQEPSLSSSTTTTNNNLETDKIVDDIVGVVCGNCHQPLPRFEATEENFFTDVSDGFVGDVVSAPPPSQQSMERIWKSIRSKSDLLSLVLPIVTVTLMVGIMCVRPSVRRRVGAILDGAFSKLRRVLFCVGPWRHSVLRR